MMILLDDDNIKILLKDDMMILSDDMIMLNDNFV